MVRRKPAKLEPPRRPRPPEPRHRTRASALDPDGLTPKQRAFVEHYDGEDGAAAARAAGISGNDRDHRRLAAMFLRNPKVKNAIARRGFKMKPMEVASKEERQKFYTQVMFDKNQTMKDRLKAAELLGRCYGDFIDRVEHSGKMDLASMVLASITNPPPTEAPRTVEAEPVPPAEPKSLPPCEEE